MHKSSETKLSTQFPSFYFPRYQTNKNLINPKDHSLKKQQKPIKPDRYITKKSKKQRKMFFFFLGTQKIHRTKTHEPRKRKSRRIVRKLTSILLFWERGLSSIVIWDFTAPKLLRRLTIEKGFWVQKDTTNIYKYISLN